MDAADDEAPILRQRVAVLNDPEFAHALGGLAHAQAEARELVVPKDDICLTCGQHAGAAQAFVEEKRAILVDALEHAGSLLRRQPRPDARTQARGPRQPSLADSDKALAAPDLIPFREASRERGQGVRLRRRREIGGLRIEQREDRIVVGQDQIALLGRHTPSTGEPGLRSRDSPRFRIDS